MTKILIVDDEAMMRMVAKRILSEQYEILTASSGAEAIDVYARERPALILSDILMPEMSGFEMHDRLRSQYGENLRIMFMTADESQAAEDESQNRGAVGFIRKPFQPNILLRRVEQLLGNTVTVVPGDDFSDALTGLPTKEALHTLLTKACNSKSGTLMLLDIDCFKLVNDIYGRNIGDILLQGFAEIIRSNTRSGDIIGRISNDEFITFFNCVSDERAISSITSRIDKGLIDYAHELMGEAMSIPLGVSVGAVYVPDCPCDYDELFNSADKALYSVKQSGKHGHAVYRNQNDEKLDDGGLQRFSQMFGEVQPHNGAFLIKPESFDYLYQFLIRYTITYHREACKLLFTILPKSPHLDANCYAEAITAFGDQISSMLRKSDLIAQVQDNQYLLLLPEITEPNADKLIERLLRGWETKGFSATVIIQFEKEMIDGDSDDTGDFVERRSTD